MNYDLLINGQNAGSFPLETLRERKRAGELTGMELVRGAGSSEWMTLDSALRDADRASNASQVPPVSAAPVQGKSRMPGWAIALVIVAGLLAIAGVGYLGWKSYKVAREIGRAVKQVRGEEGPAAASRPIVFDENTLDEKASNARSKQFRVKQYVEAYRELGRHDAPWDGDVRAMIDVWLDNYYGARTNDVRARVLGDKIIQSDCDDPLALTVAAVNAMELHEQTHRLERAVKAFENSKYNSYCRLYATVLLATQLENKSTKQQEMDQQALKLYSKAFKDGTLGKQDEEEMAEIIVNGWASEFFKRNREAVIQATEESGSFRWLALVLRGTAEISDAWVARGNATADRVTSAGWTGFLEHLEKAEEALTKAWEMEPSRPMAPASMITVAMGKADGSAEGMRLWFDRATKARIDYPAAWRSMIWGLRPRWFGSHEDMLALGIAAINTKRFDTDVPEKFLTIVSDIESELNLAPGAHTYSEHWKQFREMYEGYVAEPSKKQDERAWRTTYAIVAYFAGEYQTAREQFEAMNWKPEESYMGGWGDDLSLLPLQIAAFTGNAADAARRAERSYHEADPSEAIKLFEKLKEMGDERTQAFCQSRLVALRQEELLAKGEWIELMPSGEDDPNWSIYDEKIRRLPDGALEVETQREGHDFYCRTRVGTDFEATGEFEVVSSTSKAFQAGLIMGLPDSRSSRWYAFRMKRNEDEGDVASFSYQWTRTEVARSFGLKSDRNTFQFRLRDGGADAWVNGRQVLHNAKLSGMKLRTDSMVGLGAFHDMNETVIRYRNVKLRRLVPGSN